MIRQHTQNQHDLDKEVVKPLEDDEIIKRVAEGEKKSLCPYYPQIQSAAIQDCFVHYKQ